jgi:hypothetical protein
MFARFWVLSLLLLSLSVHARAERVLSYIELNTNTFEEMDSLLTQLELSGVRAIHIFPPEKSIPGAIIVESLGRDIQSLTVKSPKVSLVHGEDGLRGAVANENAYRTFLHVISEKEPKPTGDPEVLGDCVRGPTGNITYSDSTVYPKPLIFPPSPSDMYTANYMAGRVAVRVITPESVGHIEDWTVAELNTVLQEVVEACQHLSDMAAEHFVNLSWVYEYDRAVPIQPFELSDMIPIPVEEPIMGYGYPYNQTPYNVCYPLASFYFGWIDQIQQHFGYGGQWQGAFDMANSMRREYHSDWGIEIYVVRDVNQSPPRQFLDGLHDYAANFCVVSGISQMDYMAPMCVLPYMVANNDPSRLHEHLAHEIAHLFRAADEYANPDGQCSNSTSCDDKYGYLQVANSNCIRCCNPCLFCMMNDVGYAYACPSTIAQLGWRDENGDSVADALAHGCQPKCGGWRSILNVKPGDIVRVYTLDYDFVKTLMATNDNVFTVPAGESNLWSEGSYDLRSSDPSKIATSFMVWDGRNSDDQVCAVPGDYYYVINEQSPYYFQLSSNDQGDIPVFSGISYADGRLNWNLTVSWAYVRIFIYNSSGNLVSRHIWDRLYAPNYAQSTNVDILPSGTYTAKFYGWRSDAHSATTSYSFTHQCIHCGDADGSGAIDISDVVFLIAHIFSGGPAPLGCQYPKGLGDANGDGSVDISDVVYLIARIFSGGKAPHCQET